MRSLEVDDLARIEAAGDVRLSPGGELVAYCVSTVDIEGDRGLSQLRLASATEEPSRPPTTALVAGIVAAERPTLFFAVPTFYGALLAAAAVTGSRLPGK